MFDIELLAERLLAVALWLGHEPAVTRLAETWFLRHLGADPRSLRDRPLTTDDRVPQADMGVQC